MVFTLPPTIADDTENSQGGKGQVEDPLIQGLGGPLAQLLGCAGANGALCLHRSGGGKKKAQGQYNQPVLFYHEYFIFRMIHNSGVESQKYDY
jgi:hypothetical protein